MIGFSMRMAAALAAAGLVATPASSRERDPPDLEGVWDRAALTNLERPPRFKDLEPTEAEARAYEVSHPGEPEVLRTDPVGQGGSEWWEMGAKLGRIGGRPRSSWIVDPADGKLPYTAEGAAAAHASRVAMDTDFDGPEARPAAERCLMGASGSSAPPMVNTGYNNLLRIVQTKDHVVIVTEMNVGPRIVPLAGGPRAPGADWNGTSVGRWDGATLVVETTGFPAGAAWRAPSRLYISPAGKVTERFTRTGPDEILYAFTVEDPAVFTRPWRGEMPLRRTAQPMFEFACHEGNYSLAGILAGGREQERQAAKK